MGVSPQLTSTTPIPLSVCIRLFRKYKESRPEVSKAEMINVIPRDVRTIQHDMRILADCVWLNIRETIDDP